MSKKRTKNRRRDRSDSRRAERPRADRPAAHASEAGHGTRPKEGPVRAAEREHEHEHEDDLIAVPKGESRARFYFKLGLMVFLLIIFVVPGALMSSLSGPGGEEPVYLSWTGPGGTRELSSTDFIQERRQLLTLNETAPAFTRMRDIGNLDLLGLGDFDPKEEFDTARFLVLEDLARQEGMRATAGELAETVRNLFGGIESYRAEIGARRAYLTASAFESSLLRALVVRRFLGYLAAGAATADPEEVVARWKAEHQEYAFDYVQVACADFAEAARAELPDDPELEAWLEGLPDRRKQEYHSPLRWTAEFAYVPLSKAKVADEPDPDETEPDETEPEATEPEETEPEETEPDETGGEAPGEAGAVEERSYEALLSKYPGDPAEEPEAVARRYYDGQKFTRYRRPEPLAEPEAGVDPIHFSFDEVREAALREAPVFFALQAWHADLVKRQAQAAAEEDAPAIDLAAEAEELGLSYAPPSDPRSSPEWMEAELPWGGTDARLAGDMAGVRRDGQLVHRVVLDRTAMVVARVGERVPPSLPPFVEIREKVADAWVKEKQTELARAALEGVRELLRERPAAPEEQDPEQDQQEETSAEEPQAPGEDAEDSEDPDPREEPAGEEGEPVATPEAFAEAAREKGFEMLHREYAGRESPRLGKEGEPPIEEFLSFQPLYFDLEEGAVPEPRVGRTSEHAFLIRYAGRRAADLARMEPADVQRIRSELETEAVQDFFGRTFGSREFLEERYGLRLLDVRGERPGPARPGQPGR